MVHISHDGQVMESNPWSLSRTINGIVDVIYWFFRTLINANTSEERRHYSAGNGSSDGSGFGLRLRRRLRRIGRIHTLNVDVPPVPGGCPGGSCGR